MKARLALGIATVAVMLMVAGCAGGPIAQAPKSIVGSWQLAAGSDAKGAITVGSAVVTLRIDGAHSGGAGPCNGYGATAVGTTTGPISIRIGIHTEMACADDERNVTESRYFAAVDSVTSASLAGHTLTLAGKGVTLSFTRGP